MEYCRRRPFGSMILSVVVVVSYLLSIGQAALDSKFQFVPSSDVSRYMNLSLDVSDMRTETAIDEKKVIYERGGRGTISLQSLSLNASTMWQNVPIYNMYKADFFRLGVEHEQDKNGLFDGRPVEQYADTLVEDLFDLKLNRIEATGAVIFNVLMTYWGYLWTVLTACQSLDTNAANAAIDSAFALWVGEGQMRNDARGHMLYAFAEFAGAKFGQDSGETSVNKETITRLLTLRDKVSRGECATPDQTYVSMRNDVKMLMRQSNVMLSQMLLHYIQDVVDNDGNSDIVELLSLAMSPQIAACDTSLYVNVTDLTITHDVTLRSYKTAINQIQMSLSCLGVTCGDVGSYLDGLIPACRDPKVDPTAPLPRLAKYQPVTDVRSFAVIDRDIRQMRILMQFEAWGAAENYFKYGWNSEEFSLADIANGIPSWTDSPDFDIYTVYYDDDEAQVYGYGVDLIANALEGIGAMNDALASERQGVIIGTLESYVMYLGVIGQITTSLKACDDSNKQLASLHWDSAVAFFIGSAEGEMEGGQNGGQSIYAASKKFCKSFGTCEQSSNTIVNTVLMASLEAGAKEVQNGRCEAAETIVNEKIRPFLLTTMIQGVLYYATEASLNPTAMDAKGFLIAYTLALLPHIKNTQSVDELTFIMRPDSEIDVPATFTAIRNCLDDVGVKCGEVGKIVINNSSIGVCSGDIVPDVPLRRATSAPTIAPVTAPIYIGVEQGMNLAWGRYNFSFLDIAIRDANFSLDVRDMWFSETTQEAEKIYISRSNYATKGLSRQDNVSSLQSLTTKASLFMLGDPMYNFYRLALFDDESFENQTGWEGGWPYADAVVELALGPKNGNSAQLASKAVVALNIWITIAHKLYEAVRTCDSGGDAVEYIDSAVGLWIGQEQGEGKFNSGWSMYSMAQEAAQLYGNNEEEAGVNELLMEHFVNAQKMSQSCSIAGIPDALRIHIDEVIRVLSIPLLQHLLFHMSDNNFEYVELYALAFIPQTISVDEGAFEYLRDSLFEGFNWEATVTTDFLSALGKVLYAMRFTCDEFGDTTTASETLEGLVDVICDEQQYTFNSAFLAAYETSFDVSELARIDLDVLHIDLFMRANAKELASTVYTKGKNSRSSQGRFNTLQEIATRLPEGTSGNLKRLQRKYFGSNTTWADDIITSSLNSTSVNYSRRQRAEEVRRTLQNMVVYLETVSLSRAAIEKCKNKTVSSPYQDIENAGQEEIDQAVALYVGSIEGPFSGGNPYGLNGSGQMMYALAKEMCRPFSSCEAHGDSDANVFLLFAFSQMKESLDEGECEAAKTILEEDLLTVLPVPLVQGILFYTDENDKTPPNSKNVSLVAGAILAETLLPQFMEADNEAADTIYSNLDYSPSEVTVADGKQVVFEAVASVLDNFDIDCDTVGTLASTNLTFCNDNSSAPPANTSTSLLNGIYVTTTYVDDMANIAYDVKEMQEALNLNHSRMAETIYDDGRNSDIYDKDGKEIDLRTLSGFSTNAAATMKSNPVFQVAVYALRDGRGNYLGKDATKYADTVVKEMFSASSKTKAPLAAEAAVALNLWMELTNVLFQTVVKCKSSKLSGTDGIHSIDSAVAYWIGDGSTSDDLSDKGHLLYALADDMSNHFNINTTGHSRTNANILKLFQEAKLEISVPNACNNNPTTPRKLRHLVDRIVSLMIVVHVQALMHYLLQDREQYRVRIYAHAFVPLLAGCSPQTFKYLKEKLLDSPYQEADVQNIIVAIRSTFPCFGIKCDDVGTHTTEVPQACSDQGPNRAMAGYTPASDVRDYALLDIDSLELDILMQMGAYDAAEELYSFGKRSSSGGSGSASSLSLEYLATTTGRSVVPQFEQYQKHFGSDAKYADTMIRKGFGESTMTVVQRRVIVSVTAQYTVMYMAALQAMHEAIGSCKASSSDRTNGVAKTWDKVAAFLIGHLEGPTDGDTLDGRFLWGLSKRYCTEFKTCSVEGALSSRINDKVSTLLYAGRGALVGGSCDELRKATTSLTPLLLVPLLQASLSSALKLSRKGQVEKEILQAESYVYAQTLLPLIENVNPEAANTIRNNFPLDGQPVRDGVAAVAIAFSSVMTGLGVDCNDVGVSGDIDACTGRVSHSRRTRLMIAVGVIVGAVTLFGIVVMLRARRKPRKREDNPVFIKSNGELNHTSELLCARTDDTTSPRDSDEETDRLNDASDAMENDSPHDDDDDEYLRAIESALVSDKKQIV